jgi:hypothetical protein
VQANMLRGHQNWRSWFCILWSSTSAAGEKPGVPLLSR